MEKYYGREMVAETCLFANILLNFLLCVQQNKGIDAHDDKTEVFRLHSLSPR